MTGNTFTPMFGANKNGINPYYFTATMRFFETRVGQTANHHFIDYSSKRRWQKHILCVSITKLKVCPLRLTQSFQLH